MQSNITGRDGYIIAKALVWALDHAKTRPDHEREWSDEEDMQSILDQAFAGPKQMVETERALSAEIAQLRAHGASDDEIEAQLNAPRRLEGRP